MKIMARKPLKKASIEIKKKLKGFLEASEEEIVELLNELENQILELIKKDKFSKSGFYKLFKETFEEVYGKKLTYSRFEKGFKEWMNRNKYKTIIEDYLKFKAVRKPKNGEVILKFLFEKADAIRHRLDLERDFRQFCGGVCHFYKEQLDSLGINCNSLCKVIPLWFAYVLYKENEGNIEAVQSAIKGYGFNKVLPQSKFYLAKALEKIEKFIS